MTIRFLIFCPIGIQSGGAEALHQLCDGLNQNSQEALLVPLGTALTPISDYAKYNAPIITELALRLEDILIFPEAVKRMPSNLDLRIPRKVYTWWLSVDFASNDHASSLQISSSRVNAAWYQPRNFQQQKALVKKWVLRSKRTLESNLVAISLLSSWQKIEIAKFPALVQSHYAHEFLQDELGVASLMLSDYLSTAQVVGEVAPGTKPTVLYNPYKGNEFTQVMIALMPQIHFKPIQNMTRTEVAKAFQSADLYLDLGHFPGKDRLPREAVLHNCPILIAKRGAARNEVDFNIPETFKIDLALDGPTEVAARINTLLESREWANEELRGFRKVVENDFDQFMREVHSFIDDASRT